MRDVISENELDLFNNQKFNAYLNLRGKSEDYPENNPVIGNLTAEGCENFLQYIPFNINFTGCLLDNRKLLYQDTGINL
jgi:hypothetical protein